MTPTGPHARPHDHLDGRGDTHVGARLDAPDPGRRPANTDPTPGSTAGPTPDPTPGPTPGPTAGPTRWLARGWGIVIATAFAGPMVFLLLQVVSDPAVVSAAMGDGRLVPPLLRTLLLATLVSATSAVIGTATAWLVTRTVLGSRRGWRLLLAMPLVVPSFIGGFTFLSAFGPGGLMANLVGLVGIDWTIKVRGLVGSWVVLTLFTYPYVHLLVASRLNQLPPSLEEAARLFGRTPRQVFTEVVLPQLRPAIAAGSLLVFLYTVSDFGVVDLMRYNVLTRVIYASRIADVGLSFTLSLSLGVLALLVASLERLSSSRDRIAGARSVAGLKVALGRWRLPATGFLTVVVGLALAVPTVVLGQWLVRGIMVDASSLILDDPSRLWQPLWATLRVSVEAAVIATVVVVPIAHLAVRQRDRVARTAGTVVVAGFALPGLAISLALVYWLRNTPVYQTEIALLAAYVIHFGAQSLRAAEVGVASVPDHLREASRVLGASAWRRWRVVELPLMMPSLLAGAGLVLLSVMKELPATLLLSPNGFQTLATRIWSAASEAYWTDAAIPSLLLLAMSGTLTWLLVIRRSDAV